MIKHISNKLVRYLISSEVIDDNADCIDYYRYGFEITISSLLNIVIILIIGALMHHFLESVAFLLCFIPVRQFTGGYHADTYLKCNASFAILFSLLILIFSLTVNYITDYAVLAMIIFSLTVFISECPVEHPNKKLNNDQKKRSKKIAVLLGTIFGILGLISEIKSFALGLIFPYTLVLISLLVIVAALKKIREEEA